MSEKALFITGASSGIGAATARQTIANGWTVGLFARSEDKLNALVDELGDRAIALPGDVTDFESVKAAMDKFANHASGINAVYANAGAGLSAAGTDAGDPDEWERMIKVNVMGVLWTVKAAMPHLKESKGHMLLTGSAAGRRHIAGSVYGGRCTLIAPGMVDTPFFEEPKPDKLQPEDVADAVLHALEANARCAVNEIFLMPTQ